MILQPRSREEEWNSPHALCPPFHSSDLSLPSFPLSKGTCCPDSLISSPCHPCIVWRGLPFLISLPSCVFLGSRISF